MAKQKRLGIYPAVVSARVDPATAAAIDRAAAQRGVNRTDFARHVLTAAVGASPPIPIRRRYVPSGAELAAIDANLGRISGNLQRLYTLAVDKGFDPGDFAEIRRELLAARAEVRAVIGGPRDGGGAP